MFFSHNPMTTLSEYPNSAFGMELLYIQELYGVTISENTVREVNGVWRLLISFPTNGGLL